MAAYDNYKDDSFYTFYKKYAGISPNEFVTTHLDLLTASVPNITESYLNARSNGLKVLENRISSISPGIDISFLTDKDVHYGFVFDNNDQNIYDILILGHQEYVTQEEYDNFKKFVESGGILILFNSNVFYTEVAYNTVDDEITLVQGHSWAFDGDKAWLSVLERWKAETSEWIGSNFFNCGQGCYIDFKNNPFSYVQHEEQYITNPNVNILIDYKAQSMYNILVAAYELEYGKGKVISFGIFGDDIIHDKEFLRYFDQLFFSHVSLV
jgi:YHS domain-containing protein